eukprot:TRINITY_DN5408_c0_g1_i6.p1 TRINITY_DN5408_c0_g1~~TRINITY_DN5408_c0_g1_i6.p1  ORF type:complete len:386 (-),score=145.53 TRINITY_DN5408_c0_g1_i6:34-1191(-)
MGNDNKLIEKTIDIKPGVTVEAYVRLWTWLNGQFKMQVDQTAPFAAILIDCATPVTLPFLYLYRSENDKGKGPLVDIQLGRSDRAWVFVGKLKVYLSMVAGNTEVFGSNIDIRFDIASFYAEASVKFFKVVGASVMIRGDWGSVRNMGFEIQAKLTIGSQDPIGQEVTKAVQEADSAVRKAPVSPLCPANLKPDDEDQDDVRTDSEDRSSEEYEYSRPSMKDLGMEVELEGYRTDTNITGETNAAMQQLIWEAEKESKLTGEDMFSIFRRKQDIWSQTQSHLEQDSSVAVTGICDYVKQRWEKFMKRMSTFSIELSFKARLGMDWTGIQVGWKVTYGKKSLTGTLTLDFNSLGALKSVVSSVWEALKKKVWSKIQDVVDFLKKLF